MVCGYMIHLKVSKFASLIGQNTRSSLYKWISAKGELLLDYLLKRQDLLFTSNIQNVESLQKSDSFFTIFTL